MSDFVRLGDIAHIEISNVDKKSKAGESSVKLCNFVDVYHNWAITNHCAKEFMRATANSNAISKYSVHKGNVAITKDSETRDDIGVATYIADEISSCVLGYHCALIQPDPTMLNGKYLNVVLHTNYAQRYFEANASGSGQRYTLTNQIIEDFPVPMYSLKIQETIGNMASYIDRKIENNNLVSTQLESMAKTIYDYWFLQFDFPDENGRPYKSSGGKMVWNEELKREIPKGWKVKRLHDVCHYVNDRINSKELNKNNYIGTDNMLNDMHGIRPSGYVPKNGDSNRYQSGDILIANIRPYFKKIWLADRSGGNSSDVLCIRPSHNSLSGFLYGTLARDMFFTYDMAGAKGSKMPRGDKKHIMEYLLPYDADRAAHFSKVIQPIYDKVHANYQENQKLVSLRDFLLPMLMNGQVIFKEDA